MRQELIGTIVLLLTDVEGSTRLWEQSPDPVDPGHPRPKTPAPWAESRALPVTLSED